jgi:hypothetical protein
MGPGVGQIIGGGIARIQPKLHKSAVKNHTLGVFLPNRLQICADFAEFT